MGVGGGGGSNDEMERSRAVSVSLDCCSDRWSVVFIKTMVLLYLPTCVNVNHGDDLDNTGCKGVKCCYCLGFLKQTE